MAELLLGVGVPALAFALHVVAWRGRLVPRSVGWLLVLFVVAAGILGTLSFVEVLPRPGDGPGWVRALLAGLGAWGVYLSTYCAVADDSPSAAMLVRVERGGPEGVPLEHLRESWGTDDEILVRLADLCQAGWARRDGDVYRLTLRGRVFLGLVRALRRPLTSAPMEG